MFCHCLLVGAIFSSYEKVMNIVAQKKFWSEKKLLVRKNYWSEKIFVQKNTFALKQFCQKKVVPKDFLVGRRINFLALDTPTYQIPGPTRPRAIRKIPA